MKLEKTFPLLLLLVFIGGCRYEPSRKNGDNTQIEDSGLYALTKDLKDVYFRFPSPREMFSFIDSAGITFAPAVLNPISQIDNYMTSLDQALNMGVYSADLAYITLFQRYKESLDYLQAVYLLSEKLRISSAFEKSLIDRIDNNIRNIDSLDAISEEAFSSIVDYLSANDKENIFAIISTGSFIEFMNITLTVSGAYSPENITSQKILDQKIVYKNIIKYSSEFTDDENIRNVLDMLKPLTDFYEQLPKTAEKTKVTESPDGQLVFEGKKQFRISAEQYTELKRIISEIRSKITNAEV